MIRYTADRFPSWLYSEGDSHLVRRGADFRSGYKVLGLMLRGVFVGAFWVLFGFFFAFTKLGKVGLIEMNL